MPRARPSPSPRRSCRRRRRFARPDRRYCRGRRRRPRLLPSGARPGGGDAGSPVCRAAACFLARSCFVPAAACPPRAGAPPAVALCDAIYRSGALVFGGGHVVLPLLRTRWSIPAGSPRRFPAGYGAAQAVPGPLFTFAAYLGAACAPPAASWRGGRAGRDFPSGDARADGRCLFGITCARARFARGDGGRQRRRRRAPGRGALRSRVDERGADAARFRARRRGFVLLVAWRTPPVWVVAAGAAAGAVQAVAGYAAH